MIRSHLNRRYFGEDTYGSVYFNGGPQHDHMELVPVVSVHHRKTSCLVDGTSSSPRDPDGNEEERLKTRGVHRSHRHPPRHTKFCQGGGGEMVNWRKEGVYRQLLDDTQPVSRP